MPKWYLPHKLLRTKLWSNTFCTLCHICSTSLLETLKSNKMTQIIGLILHEVDPRECFIHRYRQCCRSWSSAVVESANLKQTIREREREQKPRQYWTRRAFLSSFSNITTISIILALYHVLINYGQFKACGGMWQAFSTLYYFLRRIWVSVNFSAHGGSWNQSSIDAETWHSCQFLAPEGLPAASWFLEISILTTTL